MNSKKNDDKDDKHSDVLKATVKTGHRITRCRLYFNRGSTFDEAAVFMFSVIMLRTLDGVSFTTGTIWNVNCTRVCFKPRDRVAEGSRMCLKVH